MLMLSRLLMSHTLICHTPCRIFKHESLCGAVAGSLEQLTLNQEIPGLNPLTAILNNAWASLFSPCCVGSSRFMNKDLAANSGD